MLRKFLLAACAALGIVSMPAHTQAPAGKLTVEDIWKSPTMASLNISPSGKYLAATTPIRGRMNLTIVDLEARTANGITGYTDFDVQGINWIGDDRLVYSLGQNNSPTGAGRFDGGGLFVINRDGKDLKRLSTTVREARARGDYVFRGLRFARRIPGNTNEIIAAGNMIDAVSTDLYRLDLNTGKYTLITRGRPADRTGNWIMDRKLTPRVVTASVKDTLISVVYYREGEDSPWIEIARNDAANKGNVFVPLSIESDDKTLQVASNHASDTMAIYRFDPVAKKFGEKIAAHPRYDMGATLQGERIGGVVTDPDTDRLLGYSVNAGKPEVVWLDKDYAATQAALDGALPNAINSFRRLPGGSKRMLVTSYSDTKPVRWYIFDEAAKTLERIGISRPWLEGKLTEQRIMSFKTRDGLDIAGYYFLPKDYKPGTKLPTVVHIHGGPFARADYWGSGFGYNEGQLFAANGYAVIVPNFRVTPELGSKIYYAGFGAYGREMSDDHEDALKWGIEQGFVDPGRVCISGASYGGYAALQALVRNNDMWKCAVAGLAVTDLKYQLTSRDGDTAGDEAGVTYWKNVLGSDDLDAPKIRDASPVFNASKIKRPVFFYSGEDDIRVPLPQINRMVRELEAAGNPPKAHLVKKEEGHGFGKEENRYDTWTRILAFLNEQIGSK